MANQRIGFDIFANDHGATRTFDKFGRSVDGAHKGFARISTSAGKLKLGLGIVGKAVGALGAGFVAVGAVNVFKGFINDAQESQKVSKQTTAVLKSTGGAARVTAGHVSNLAGKLSMVSGVDDEVIQSGENVLLTFKGIRNEAGKGNRIFDQATGLALDMSRALGQDLQSSVIQVGKALNDPIRGLTALQRVGVTFTDQQKKQITALVRSGHTLKAQKIILHELKSEFGGAAKAAANPWDKVKVALGNVSEAIGKAFLPATNKVANWLAKKLPHAVNVATKVLKPLGKALSIGVKFSLGGLGKVGGFLADFHRGLTAQTRATKDELGRTKIEPFVPNTAGEKLGAAFKSMFSGKGLNVTGLVNRLVAKLNHTLRTTDWSKVGRTVGNGIAGGASIGRSGETGLADAFISGLSHVDWGHVFFAAGMASGNATISFWKGIGKDFYKTSRHAGAQIAHAIIAGAKGGLSPHALWHAITTMFRFTIKAAKGILGIHSPSRVFATIGRQIVQGLINGVADKVGAAVTGARKLAARVQGVFRNAGRWLVGEGRAFVGGMRNGIGDRAGSLLNRARSLGASLRGVFAHTGTWIYRKGVDLLTGFWNGMKRPWNSIKKWVSSIAKVIKNLKGPIAADRNLLVPEGKAIMSGLLKGIKSGFGPVVGAVRGIGGSIGQILQQVASRFGWGSGPQLAAIKWIVSHESGGNPNAQNPTSSAYGLFQFLNGTWGTVGGHKTSNPVLQTLYGLRYIKRSYGSPLGAMAFWQRHHWYKRGGLFNAGQWIGVGDAGPELVKFRHPGRVYSNSQSARMLASGSGGINVTVNYPPPGVSGKDLALQVERELTTLKKRVRGGTKLAFEA